MASSSPFGLSSSAGGGGGLAMGSGGASLVKQSGGGGGAVGTGEMEGRLPAEYSDKIVRFHHLHLASLKLKGRIVHLEEASRKLRDGAEEMALRLDLDGVRTSIGDAFFTLPAEEVEERVEASTAALTKELEEKTAEKEAIDDELSMIKAELYAKFGSSINLD